MDTNCQKIVVTGGTGFIGSHLVDRLVADTSAEVVVLDNLQHGRRAHLAAVDANPRLQIVEADVCDPAAVDDALRGATVVYHLAAHRKLHSTDWGVDHSFRTNVVGTLNVLRSAVQHAVRRLVFTSSRDTYGQPVVLPVDEDHPLLPTTAYGASKIAGEAYCRVFRRRFGLDTVVLRLANVYGPRDSRRVIPLWIKQASAGEELVVYGGDQVIDLIGVGEIVEALMRAATVDGPLPPINVASGSGTRLIDLARHINRAAGGRGRVSIRPARHADCTRFVANVDRMRHLLAVEPPAEPLGHLRALCAPAALGAHREERHATSAVRR